MRVNLYSIVCSVSVTVTVVTACFLCFRVSAEETALGQAALQDNMSAACERVLLDREYGDFLAVVPRLVRDALDERAIPCYATDLAQLTGMGDVLSLPAESGVTRPPTMARFDCLYSFRRPDIGSVGMLGIRYWVTQTSFTYGIRVELPSFAHDSRFRFDARECAFQQTLDNGVFYFWGRRFEQKLSYKMDTSSVDLLGAFRVEELFGHWMSRGFPRRIPDLQPTQPIARIVSQDGSSISFDFDRFKRPVAIRVETADGRTAISHALEYAGSGSGPTQRLSAMNVQLKETPITLVSSAAVRMNNAMVSAPPVNAKLWVGGRLASVRYRTASAGEREISMPSEVTETRSSDGVVLRRAQISGMSLADDNMLPDDLLGVAVDYAKCGYKQDDSYKAVLAVLGVDSKPFPPETLERVAARLAQDDGPVRNSSDHVAWMEDAELRCLLTLWIHDGDGIGSALENYLHSVETIAGPDVALISGGHFLKRVIWEKRSDLLEQCFRAFCVYAVGAADADTLMGYANYALATECNKWCACRLIENWLVGHPETDAQMKFRLMVAQAQMLETLACLDQLYVQNWSSANALPPTFDAKTQKDIRDRQIPDVVKRALGLFADCQACSGNVQVLAAYREILSIRSRLSL